MSLKEELERILNHNCQENESNTPDFILAEFMLGCLNIFEDCVNARDKWYSVHLEPTNSYFEKTGE